MNCNGKIIDLSTPKIMGILNITPNSFYDGGKFKSDSDFLTQTEIMISDGATIIDIGAYSSKPNAEIVTYNEEINRIVPILEIILKKFPEVVISIDTFRSDVARVCIENGVSIINDISAGDLDDKMIETIAKYSVPYIMMHMRGTPQSMQNYTNYDNIIKEMLFYFSKKVALAQSFGIKDLIIDPGFGFAKTREQNFEVLQRIELFQMLELPVLVGLSRKSMIYKTLNINAEKALNGTTALHMIALTKGTKILRVHDVKEAAECVKLFGQLQITN